MFRRRREVFWNIGRFSNWMDIEEQIEKKKMK